MRRAPAPRIDATHGEMVAKSYAISGEHLILYEEHRITKVVKNTRVEEVPQNAKVGEMAQEMQLRSG